MAHGLGTTYGRAGTGRGLRLHAMGAISIARVLALGARAAGWWSAGMLAGWTRERGTWSVIYATADAAALLWLLLFGLR